MASTALLAWEGMNMPALHVEGRYLKDAAGNTVLLHGYAQTFSPWFNERGTQWNNYDVDKCLSYNQGIIDKIMAAGWKMNFVRMHMDPYWSNTPSSRIIPESDISAFSFDRFKKYLSQVFIPMAQYAASKGMYVVMRPPGVCPDSICVGDAYQQYLIKVWDYVARQPELRNNPAILYELANEPIGIYHADHTRAGDKEMTAYMQPVVDAVRKHCNNIVLVPGLGYQSHYAGYADYPLQGSNIGFAVHCYPGWYNGTHDGSKEITIDYANFRKNWHEQISTIANIAPVVVTEMDWAPVKYNASFGKSTTGTVGGTGFGANFKQIVDDDGNISWLIFTTPELLARYEEKAATGTADLTVLNDPEACIWPAYHWYQEYATHNYPSDKAYGSTISRGQAVSIQPNHTYQLLLPSSGHNFTITATYEDGSTDNVTGQIDLISSSAAVHALKGRLQGIKEGKSTIEVTYRNANGSTCRTQMQAEVKTFPLHEGIFNPSIWEKGTFDESTGRLQTGRWGFGGWQYNMGIDLSAYHYLIVELKEKQQCSTSFRLFDTNNYWTKPAAYNFDNNTRLVIDLQNMKKNDTSEKCQPSHIYIAGFWTTGSSPIKIKDIFLSNDANATSGIQHTMKPEKNYHRNIYSITGQLLRTDGQQSLLPKGIYIVNGKKIKM